MTYIDKALRALWPHRQQPPQRCGVNRPDVAVDKLRERGLIAVVRVLEEKGPIVCHACAIFLNDAGRQSAQSFFAATARVLAERALAEKVSPLNADLGGRGTDDPGR